MIQSIPSPKAEPFKRWLAKVGYERVQALLLSSRTWLRAKMRDLTNYWMTPWSLLAFH